MHKAVSWQITIHGLKHKAIYLVFPIFITMQRYGNNNSKDVYDVTSCL